jgi:hypothetical protein
MTLQGTRAREPAHTVALTGQLADAKLAQFDSRETFAGGMIALAGN